MSVILIHGINTDGSSNVDRVGLRLADRGHKVVDVKLPKRHFISAWWSADEDAERVLDASFEGDVLVAHSNGCRIAAHAMRRREYSAAVLIAPAMSRKWEFGNPDRVYCYCSADDWVVQLGSIIPFHPFGRAGTRGFDQLSDQNIRYRRSDHDDYFGGEGLTKLVDEIALIIGRHAA